MSTKNLVKKMNKSRDVQPSQMSGQEAKEIDIERLEAQITDKVQDIVEDLMIQKELAEADEEAENLDDLKDKIKSLTTAFKQMKISYNKSLEKYRNLTNRIDTFLQEIEEAKEKKKSKWKGLFS